MRRKQSADLQFLEKSFQSTTNLMELLSEERMPQLRRPNLKKPTIIEAGPENKAEVLEDWTTLHQFHVSAQLLNLLRSLTFSAKDGDSLSRIKGMAMRLGHNGELDEGLASRGSASLAHLVLSIHIYFTYGANLSDFVQTLGKDAKVLQASPSLNNTTSYNVWSIMANSDSSVVCEAGGQLWKVCLIKEHQTFWKDSTLFISLTQLEIAVGGRGTLDLHFSCLLLQKLPAPVRHLLFIKSSSALKMFSSQFQKICKSRLEIAYLSKEYPYALPNLEERKARLEEWFRRNRQDLAHKVLDLNRLEKQIVKGLKGERVEQLLILLLGSNDQEKREVATRLLNVYYDGVDWQIHIPFSVTVARVGGKFQINFLIDFIEDIQRLAFLIKSPYAGQSKEEGFLTWHLPSFREYKSCNTTDGRYLWVSLDLGRFQRCGFYDWKLVYLSKAGVITGVTEIVDLKNFKSSVNALNRTQEAKTVQGRFVVQPSDCKDLVMHEVLVDLENKQSFTAPLERRGNFQKLCGNMAYYKEVGVKALYISGALERDNGPVVNQYSKEVSYQRPEVSPMAVTCRNQINRMLGGEEAFRKAVSRAKEVGIKVLVDCLARVSSSRMHHKYRDLICSVIDQSGRKGFLYGSEGRSVSFEDTVQLNYRKKESWDLLFNEAVELVSRMGLDGLVLDNGQTWPRIFKADEKELYRKECDGSPAYSEAQVVEAEIVTNEESGYWATSLKDNYANPFIARLCRKLWREYPSLLIVSQCWSSTEGFEERSLSTIRSGPIPRVFSLPRAVSQLFGESLNKDGSIVKSEPRNIHVIRNWFDQSHGLLPRGSIIITSTTSHSWPYPALLFKRATWAVIDLFYTLQDIPMTLIGEHEGHTFRPQTLNVYEKARRRNDMPLEESISQLNKLNSGIFTHDSHVAAKSLISGFSISNMHESRIRDAEDQLRREIGPQYGFDLQQIWKHYQHRAQLRQRLRPLRRGEYISISAEHLEGWHTKVMAFARFTKKQFCIVAVNFNDSPVFTHFNFKSLKSKFPDYENSDLVVELVDELQTSPRQNNYYFISEFLKDRIETEIEAFRSVIWRAIIRTEPEAKRLAVDSSIGRLRSKVNSAVPASVYSNYATDYLLKILSESKGVQDFSVGLHTLCRLLKGHGLSLEQVVPKIVSLQKDRLIKAKLFAFFQKTIQCHPKQFQGLGQVLRQNRLGTIAFVTPEVGKWSTMGGLGVMIDELSKQLQCFGENVVVVSPFYDRNKKGESDYLRRDGIQHLHNLQVYSGPEHYTIGVHYGRIGGIDYYFLHNPFLFPQAYAGEDPLYVMRQLVFFAKGVLENFCKVKVFPSLLVTNDWFCGLVPAYVKMGKFGGVFTGTKFMHIVHNLDSTYEGRLYPKPDQGNLGWLNELALEWMVDPFWQKLVLNPSRCALITCDNWGTVSHSYKFDLMTSSALSPLLCNHASAFSFPNGVRTKDRLQILVKQTPGNHLESKAKLQQKYFGLSKLNDKIPLFSFVGRVTKQKGVHLILDVIDQILSKHECHFIVGGPADSREEYSKSCANHMNHLRSKHPDHFWADPAQFFYDGPLVNLGSDFGMMPSLFEPGGIVQQEYFVAGTPVVAFKTGGLKDTVFQFNFKTKKGNGINFMHHNQNNYKEAMLRAIALYNDRENYETCRSNARNSVIDLQDVGRNWNQQFYRMQKKLFVEWNLVEQIKNSLEVKEFELQPRQQQDLLHKKKGVVVTKRDQVVQQFEKVLVAAKRQNLRLQTFTYCTQKIPSPLVVTLSGSWDNWATSKKLKYDAYAKSWHVSLRLPPGNFMFKFNVDDRWETSDQYQRQEDSKGYVNNVITVL